MWNDIQAEIQNVENIHNNLKNIAAQKKNLQQLELFQQQFLANYHNMGSFSKFFTFGNLNVSVLNI